MVQDRKRNQKHSGAVLFIAPGTLEVPNTRGGGIEQNVLALARRMRVRCRIFSPRGRLKGNRVTRPSVDYSVVPATRVYPMNPRFGISELPEVIRLVLYNFTAAIHVLRHSKLFRTITVFEYFFGVIPLLLSKILGKKCVYMEYNITPWLYDSTGRHNVANKLQMIFGKFVISKCSLITANSPSIIKGMVRAGVPASKLMLVPTILDIPKEFQYSSEVGTATRLANQVTYIGRLVEERGAEMLPAIISRVLKRRADIRFVIAGDGPLRNELEIFARSRKAAGHVDILGQVPREEVFKLIIRSSVAIFISRRENFGSLALEECLRMGCPVIATKVGSTRLRIMDEINGILSDPNPNGIANAVVEFLSSDKLRLKIESNLEKSKLAFNQEKIVATFSHALLL